MTARTRDILKRVTEPKAQREFMLSRLANLAGIAFLFVVALANGAPCVHAERAPLPQRLMPGDRIGIKFFDAEQISGSYLIDSAGSITLPIVGAINVAGLTLEDMQKAIEGVLGNGYFNRPVISVRVEEFRPVYIHGYVRTPGAYPYRTGLTAVGAIALAGGAPSASTMALALTTDLLTAQERVDVLVARRTELTIRGAALEALRDGRNVVDAAVIPDDVQAYRKFADYLDNERRKFEIETKSLEDELHVLRKQQPQLQSERDAIDAEIAAQSKLLELSAARYARLDSLREKGLARIEGIMEAAQQQALAQGTIARLKAQRSRNEIENAGVELKIVEKQNIFKQKVTQLLNDARRGLHETDIQLVHARKVLELRRQAAGYGTAPSAPHTFFIRRLVEGEPRTIPGNSWTPIEPGDIIEVRNFDADIGPGTMEVPDRTRSTPTGSLEGHPAGRSPPSIAKPLNGDVKYGLAFPQSKSTSASGEK
jgi:polysaccharide biosynthesis/export protein